MSLYGGPKILLEYAQRRGLLDVIPFPKSGIPVLRIHKPNDLRVFLEEIIEETDSDVERLFAQDVLRQMKGIQEKLRQAVQEAKERIQDQYGEDACMVEDGETLQLIPQGFLTELMKNKNATFSDEELRQYREALDECDTPEQFLATFFGESNGASK